MKILHLDSLGGASGDMLLGVLIGLGAKREELEADLRSVLPDHFHLTVAEVTNGGITGVRAGVDLHDHGDGHDHGHTHDHDHGSHDHHHRTMGDIRVLIGDAPLPEAVKAMAVAVFTMLAEAEGRVHGVPADEVHFHEVGAADSIIDIVGCSLAFHRLGIDAVSLSPLPTGSGTLRCEHGILPIPAPATAEILRSSGLKIAPSLETVELLTPTGAALLAAWPKAEVPAGAKITAVVNSFGKRTLRHTPNLLRGMLFESAAAGSQKDDQVCRFECEIDDATGEILGAACRLLMAAGALDVTTEAVMMKKQRPGVRLCVLCPVADRERIAELIFRHTTTFGIRESLLRRRVLERHFEDVETPYGKIRVKVGTLGSEVIRRTPEFEDCRRAAEQHGVPVAAVLTAAAR
ncbi:MAG: nickel pincer cofactor biosynthesis protein LarC [Victivallaceae bacterium]